MPAPLPSLDLALLHWLGADGQACQAMWRSEAGVSPPGRCVLADDRLPADQAYRLACEGTALLWQGDFQNARHLLQALARRLDRTSQAGRKPHGAKRGPGTVPICTPDDAPGQAFHQHRQRQAQRARVLGMLLMPLEADYSLNLRRAPDVRQACAEVYGLPGPSSAASVVSLRELLGLIGAHEWRKAGVDVPALGGRIHAHYGVFSPVRGEYIDLVAQAPLPAGTDLAFDVGTGSGVLAAVLARRGVARVLATDTSPRALACAQDNLVRLGLAAQLGGGAGGVELLQTDMFPPGQAPLVVCNPPWLPAKPSSPIESAVYDPGSQMLRAFLAGLRGHLRPSGEGWLILSDLAEHLGLRTRAELLGWVEAGGLMVVDRLDARPRHPKVHDAADPLHRARSRETTSLWRMAAR